MSRSFTTVLLAVPLALTLSACADDGSGTRAASASGSASGSGSHAEAHEGSGAAESGVAAGVARQDAVMNEEIEHEGGEKNVGDWRIGYIVEPAEPWYEDADTFRTPAEGETHHIEILPIERSTGRLVPTVPIRLEVLDKGGKVVDAKALNFYHAEFFHYANNFSVPKAGVYTLRATLGTPEMKHHGEAGHKPMLTKGATVTFEGVRLEQEG